MPSENQIEKMNEKELALYLLKLSYKFDFDLTDLDQTLRYLSKKSELTEVVRIIIENKLNLHEVSKYACLMHGAAVGYRMHEEEIISIEEPADFTRKLQKRLKAVSAQLGLVRNGMEYVVYEIEGIPIEKLKVTIEELEISVQTQNRFANEDISSVGELLTLSKEELLKIKNFGRKSLEELKEILHDMGLEIGALKGKYTKEEIREILLRHQQQEEASKG